jgi:ubiquinone/menaquinone biosynthesis C-methylase UbiE
MTAAEHGRTSSDSIRQKAHNERIHDDYEAHYYDPSSMRYRRRFIMRPLLEGLDFNGKRVADLACGSGFNSLLLRERFPHVRTVGFDISESACEAYTRYTGNEAHAIDLTVPAVREEAFDGAIVIGGLHHCVSDLPQAIRNIAQMVRPGSWVLIMEPNAEYVLEHARTAWYRRDQYFDAQTEAALSHPALAATAAPWFDIESVRYMGGPAYFAILNSLVLRIPLGVKPLLEPLLYPIEAAINRVGIRALCPVFLARWRRTATPSDIRTTP